MVLETNLTETRIPPVVTLKQRNIPLEITPQQIRRIKTETERIRNVRYLERQDRILISSYLLVPPIMITAHYLLIYQLAKYLDN